MTAVGSCTHREDLGVVLDHTEQYSMTFNVFWFLVFIPKLDFTRHECTADLVGRTLLQTAKTTLSIEHLPTRMPSLNAQT
jgi:hypothetical protein